LLNRLPAPSTRITPEVPDATPISVLPLLPIAPFLMSNVPVPLLARRRVPDVSNWLRRRHRHLAGAGEVLPMTPGGGELAAEERAIAPLPSIITLPESYSGW
jgi:hypothetical protein